jgi:hypothetical protein
MAEGNLVVPITLENYWYEEISRDEALRRLENRNASQEKLDVAETVFENTDVIRHYLTFTNTLREFADYRGGVTNPVLKLPLGERAENEFTLIVPVVGERLASGDVRPRVGIDMHEYNFADGIFVENGVPKEGFQLVEGPTELRVDASLLQPGGDPDQFSICCVACEIVHSDLDIHDADPLCCFGDCWFWPHFLA